MGKRRNVSAQRRKYDVLHGYSAVHFDVDDMISVFSSFSDSTSSKTPQPVQCVNVFCDICDMSQKTTDISGYDPRPCNVHVVDWYYPP